MIYYSAYFLKIPTGKQKRTPRISLGCPVPLLPSCLDHCLKAGLELRCEVVIVVRDPLDALPDHLLVVCFGFPGQSIQEFLPFLYPRLRAVVVGVLKAEAVLLVAELLDLVGDEHEHLCSHCSGAIIYPGNRHFLYLVKIYQHILTLLHFFLKPEHVAKAFVAVIILKIWIVRI